MRLWSIHPKYLDSKGLVAVWREGLLAQSVLLKGEYTECPNCKIKTFEKTHGNCVTCTKKHKVKTAYYNHPQLERFKNEDIGVLGYYLSIIWHEAKDRGYNFDITKIPEMVSTKQLTVTQGQLLFEFNHLQKKLDQRDWTKWEENERSRSINSFNPFDIIPNPLFKVIEGDIESWEKVK